ncbi:MAG: MBL fold metallo-hydrolase [Actinobacteria bacterium]|nr:MBL fold metallo-hydrolase [Actinomycetota bacterium]MBU1945219.1 MBL fold metallo-hydrolase [Actinomycetota bacterium]MBU2687791.1 MBL fold metallo-hydrolase [Actinomycetota bacterium]
MSFKVTVLGSSGGYAGAGRACSGFLLERDGDSLVLDLGSGALSHLLEYREPDDIGGVALTHMHYDHYVDMHGLCTARRFWPTGLPPLPVLAPPGAGDVLTAALQESSREAFLELIDLRVASPGVEIDLAGFAITPFAAKHVMDSLAYRVGDGERTLFYTGDTEWSDELLEGARDVDMLICEATFTSQVPGKAPGHLSARDAGRLAAEAGVGRLVITHVWPTLDGKRAVEDARGQFEGPIDLALEDMVLFVGPYPCAT